MHGWDKRGGAPQPAAPTHTHGAPSLQQPILGYRWESMVSHGQSGAVATALASTQGAVQQQTDAAGFCLCERPCIYVGKTSGCKNGDACHFCHAEHYPKPKRPSRSRRNQLKDIVRDLLEKGADPSLLLALANHRPYLARLLAQYLAAARPGDSERPTLDTGRHSDGQTPGAMDDAYSDTDSDFGRMQEFLAKLAAEHFV